MSGKSSPKENNHVQIKSYFDAYVVRIFLGGLKGMNATLVAVAAPKSLNDIVAAARRVEAGNYYGQHNSEMAKQQKAKIRHLIRNCMSEKKINNSKAKDNRRRWNQNKQLNYCKISIATNEQVETLTPYQEENGVESEGSDTFNEFKYKEDNEAEEVKGYFVEWSLAEKENPALYLTNIEEIPIRDKESKEE
ncbi:24733_t:CDS:2 [Gigaspora margarita]|uniref:24733_t:CDS:1 n=1 Tax=Gigaspora margarita TaxID=4874 RepID=A0ABN7VQS2_GIGMA|nr:24733_t:CDS:2 [Gigaspora margarita]